MADDKDTQQSNNQQEANPVNVNSVEQHLAQYHQLALALRASSDIEQIALALEPLINLADVDQIAYLKALGQEDSSDAADVAQGIYNIAPDKDVRQEARRTLVRLETQDIYPQWDIAAEGLISSSTVTESTLEDLPDRKRPDPTDDTTQTIDSLLQDLEDFFESLPSNPTIESVAALLESFGEGDPDEAYNTLSPDSPLREELDAETWIKQRTDWLEAAQAGPVNISYVGVKEQLTPDRVIVEATWSLPIGNPTAEHPPKDLPTASCVFKDTGRHWYWTSYTVVEDDDEWHVTDMTD